MKIKQTIFEVIQPDDGTSRASHCFDSVITVLILVSIIAVFATTFDLPKPLGEALIAVECVASIVFTVEYALRIVTADLLYPNASWLGARIRYICSPLAIIDLLSILPFWLPVMLPESLLGMRALRLVRLLRILKLNRYFEAVQSLWGAVVGKRRELLGSMFFVCLLMLVSSLLMYAVEHDAQPDVFRNAFSGLWWAIATLTTVGYGDIYPVTVLGRVLGAVIALSGIAALAVPTGIITSGLMERAERNSDVKPAQNGAMFATYDEAIAAQQKILATMAEEMSEIRQVMEGLLPQKGASVVCRKKAKADDGSQLPRPDGCLASLGCSPRGDVSCR